MYSVRLTVDVVVEVVYGCVIAVLMSVESIDVGNSSLDCDFGTIFRFHQSVLFSIDFIMKPNVYHRGLNGLCVCVFYCRD